MAGHWNLTHNPMARPLGCNGKYGRSGAAAHTRRGTAICQKCRDSRSHYRRELARGQPNPRVLKPCGTKAAACRHRAKGEPLDFACRLAEAEEALERTRKKRASKKAMDVHQ